MEVDIRKKKIASLLPFLWMIGGSHIRKVTVILANLQETPPLVTFPPHYNSLKRKRRGNYSLLETMTVNLSRLKLTVWQWERIRQLLQSWRCYTVVAGEPGVVLLFFSCFTRFPALLFFSFLCSRSPATRKKGNGGRTLLNKEIGKGKVNRCLFLFFSAVNRQLTGGGEERRTLTACQPGTSRYAEEIVANGREGKVLRVLLSGRWLPHNQGWLNFWETRLVTVRKSLRHSCWTELTCQGILLP